MMGTMDSRGLEVLTGRIPGRGLTMTPVIPATTNSNQSRHYAIWVPVVEGSAEYNVEVFIPSGINATTGAIYEMYIKNGSGTAQE